MVNSTCFTPVHICWSGSCNVGLFWVSDEMRPSSVYLLSTPLQAIDSLEVEVALRQWSDVMWVSGQLCCLFFLFDRNSRHIIVLRVISTTMMDWTKCRQVWKQTGLWNFNAWDWYSTWNEHQVSQNGFIEAVDVRFSTIYAESIFSALGQVYIQSSLWSCYYLFYLGFYLPTLHIAKWSL